MILSRRAFCSTAVATALAIGLSSSANAYVGEPLRVAYGPEADQFGDLYLPTSGSALPVVVMIHGGGWLEEHDLSYTGKLAETLTPSGVAVWNIEYRRVRGAGGWPMTLADVVYATEALTGVVQERSGGRLDPNRVHVAGHSAGGHLAAWLAGRHAMTEYAPGAAPTVRVHGATTMAGVFDLARAANDGDAFLPGLLGGRPDEVPDRYRIASPIDQLPIGVPLTAFHGDSDRTVAVGQSIDYVAAARRLGDPANIRILRGVGHGEVADPTTQAWETVRRHLVETTRRQ